MDCSVTEIFDTWLTGCDVNLPDITGSTPLLRACDLGNEEIVDALLRHPRVEVDRGTMQLPLHAAAFGGSSVIVERLINAGADVNKVRLIIGLLLDHNRHRTHNSRFTHKEAFNPHTHGLIHCETDY